MYHLGDKERITINMHRIFRQILRDTGTLFLEVAEDRPKCHPTIIEILQEIQTVSKKWLIKC